MKYKSLDFVHGELTDGCGLLLVDLVRLTGCPALMLYNDLTEIYFNLSLLLSQRLV